MRDQQAGAKTGKRGLAGDAGKDRTSAATAKRMCDRFVTHSHRPMSSISNFCRFCVESDNVCY